MGLPLQVFILGLATVFLVLMVVVATGRAIISFVNRFMDASPIRAKDRRAAATAVSPKHMAAIVAALRVHSRGKARVESIERLEGNPT